MAILSLADLKESGFVEAWLDAETVRDDRCKTPRRELRESFQKHLEESEGTHREAVAAKTFYNYLEKVLGFRPVFTFKKLGVRGIAIKGTAEAERCTFVFGPSEHEVLFNKLISWLEPCDSTELIKAQNLRWRFMVWFALDKVTPIQFGLLMAEFMENFGGERVRKPEGTYYRGVCRVRPDSGESARSGR